MASRWQRWNHEVQRRNMLHNYFKENDILKLLTIRFSFSSFVRISQCIRTKNEACKLMAFSCCEMGAAALSGCFGYRRLLFWSLISFVFHDKWFVVSRIFGWMVVFCFDVFGLFVLSLRKIFHPALILKQYRGFCVTMRLHHYLCDCTYIYGTSIFCTRSPVDIFHLGAYLQFSRSCVI